MQQLAAIAPLAAGPDLTLTRERYENVAGFLHRFAGIRLRAGKEALVVSRLGRRVRATGMRSLGEYLDAVIAGALPEELPHFVDMLTTNKTGFFREAAHFEYLAEEVLPALARRGREIRCWSAACSSGEEPYTLAMVLRDHLPATAAARTRVLATDLSHRMLEAATAGRYAAATVAGLDEAVVRRHFVKVAGEYALRREVRSLVRFGWLNLMGEWPMRGPFDVILCRNVMIYFDRDTQARLVRRLASLLAPGGVLCIGHAEFLPTVPPELEVVRPAIYRRVGRGA